jgi:hypothetical protein
MSLALRLFQTPRCPSCISERRADVAKIKGHCGGIRYVLLSWSDPVITRDFRPVRPGSCTGSQEGILRRLHAGMWLIAWQNGIDYVVVDKEASPRDRNWGATIAWSHPLLAKLLPEELYDRLPECQPDPGLDTKVAGFESVIIRDGKAGETIVEPPFPGVRRLNIQKTRTIWA